MNRFKPTYSLRQLIEFEKDKAIMTQKTRATLILLVGFVVYSIVASIPGFWIDYKHGIVTNISIAILFIFLSIILKYTHNHIMVTIVGTYMFMLILFFHLLMETDWSIGMDAFWLFVLITPFITNYLAGVFYGSISALSGLILSIVLFYTPLQYCLQPYGENMMQWFAIIYIVGMMSAAVIEYELTSFQIAKAETDAKLAYYQTVRANRLKEQLQIYDTNEKVIRKYKHDIRHFNRVLAGFINEKKYDEASAYLKEFDSMLEDVTAVSFCDNQIVNELLTIYTSRCQKMGFKLRVKVSVPEHFPMEEMDLTSLVANALENAVEAQERITDKEKRSIQFELTYDGRKLKLLTKNPCVIATRFTENGLPISTREVQSGIGTSQIKSIAEKYSGVASFIQNEDSFTVKAVMTCM